MPGIFAPRKQIKFEGLGTGGTEFDFLKLGQVVAKVEASSDEQSIRSIRLTFTDRTTSTIGSEEEAYQQCISFDYESGERITSVSIWKKSAFRIKTNKGKEIFIQTMVPQPGNEKTMPLGSGILLGAFGKHVDNVRSLGFSMLDKIRRVDNEERGVWSKSVVAMT